MFRSLLSGIFLFHGIFSSHAEENLLRNASFEEGKPSEITCWTLDYGKGKGSFQVVREASGGPRFLRIHHRSSGYAWFRVSQKVKCKSGKRYLLSGRIRSKSPYDVELYQFNATGQLKSGVPAAQGRSTKGIWTTFRFAFETMPEVKSLMVSLVAQEQGTVDYDDLVLQELLLAQREMEIADTGGNSFHVDGIPDEAFWRDIPFSEPFLILGTSREFPWKTSVKVSGDQSGLRAAFFCAEPEMDNIQARAENDGIHVYHDDCVEIFLEKPASDGGGLFQFAGNTAGVKGGEFRAQQRLAANWHDYGDGPVSINTGYEYAAAGNASDWTAEFYIPWKLLGIRPEKGGQIRINFARERQAGGKTEYASWANSPVVRFLHPQSLGTMKCLYGVPGGKQSETVQSPRMENLPDMTTFESYRNTLYPIPRRYESGMGSFELAGAAVSGADNALLRNRIALLNRILGERFHAEKLKISGPGRRIQITLEPNFLPDLPGFRDARPDPAMPSLREQSYSLTIKPSAITLRAAAPTGAFYGLNTLIKLLLMQDNTALDAVRIEDAPVFQIRGLQLCAPYPECPWESLLELASLMNYNRIWLKVEYRIRNPEFPELGGAPKTMTRENMHQVVQTVRRNGMDVCPEHTVFSHAKFLSSIKGWEDIGDGGRGAMNLNVRNPRTFQALKIVFDNIFKTFEGAPIKAFNITCDELSFGPIGRSPETRGVPPHILLAETVRYWNAYLKKHGVGRVCIWGDIFKTFGPNATGAAPHNTALALASIPRDVTILDWVYDRHPDYPTLAEFRKKGFTTVPCTWFTPDNIREFLDAARKAGCHETMNTTWQQLPWIYASSALRGAYVLHAACAWNPEAVVLDRLHVLPYDYFTLLERRFKPLIRRDSRQVKFSAETGAEYPDSSPAPVLRKLREITLDGMKFRFQVGNRLSFPVGREERKLIPLEKQFLHSVMLLNATENVTESASDYLGKRFDAAVIRFLYEDGSISAVKIRYGEETGAWNTVRPPARALQAVRTATERGEYLQLFGTVLLNPHPDKKVTGLRLQSTGKTKWTVFGIAVR